MKKVYEKPMVELTVFDAEDIICASTINTDTGAAGTDAYVEILTGKYTNANTKAKFGNYKSGSYTWK